MPPITHSAPAEAHQRRALADRESLPLHLAAVPAGAVRGPPEVVVIHLAVRGAATNPHAVVMDGGGEHVTRRPRRRLGHQLPAHAVVRAPHVVEVSRAPAGSGACRRTSRCGRGRRPSAADSGRTTRRSPPPGATTRRRRTTRYRPGSPPDPRSAPHTRRTARSGHGSAPRCGRAGGTTAPAASARRRRTFTARGRRGSCAARPAPRASPRSRCARSPARSACAPRTPGRPRAARRLGSERSSPSSKRNRAARQRTSALSSVNVAAIAPAASGSPRSLSASPVVRRTAAIGSPNASRRGATSPLVLDQPQQHDRLSAHGQVRVGGERDDPGQQSPCRPPDFGAPGNGRANRGHPDRGSVFGGPVLALRLVQIGGERAIGQPREPIRDRTARAPPPRRWRRPPRSPRSACRARPSAAPSADSWRPAWPASPPRRSGGRVRGGSPHHHRSPSPAWGCRETPASTPAVRVRVPPRPELRPRQPRRRQSRKLCVPGSGSPASPCPASAGRP